MLQRLFINHSPVILIKQQHHYTMKLIFPLAALVAVVLAAPQGDKDAVVVRNELDNIGVDAYNFAYETSNGISQQEQGQVSNLGSDNEVLAVRGQFQYIGNDGVTYTVNYVADENGFQPEGAHIPRT